MKISEWIADLQGELEYHGDIEIDSLPRGWEDFIPDDLAFWLMRNQQIEYVLLPDGTIRCAVMGCDLDDEEDDLLATHLTYLVRHCLRCLDRDAGDLIQLQRVIQKCMRMIDKAAKAKYVRPAGIGRFETGFRSSVPPNYPQSKDDPA